MVLLKIQKIDENATYTLQNTKTKQKYNLVLEFVDLPQPKVADFLYVHPKLLKTNGVHLCFADQTSAFGKQNPNEEELAVLETNNQKYFIKRVYG